MQTQNTYYGSRDRYHWDEKLDIRDGWCDLVTEQDAPEYGNWVNFSKLSWVAFIEGDYTEIIFSTMEELVEKLNLAFEVHSNGFKHIDAHGKGLPGGVVAPGLNIPIV